MRLGRHRTCVIARKWSLCQTASLGLSAVSIVSAKTCAGQQTNNMSYGMVNRSVKIQGPIATDPSLMRSTHVICAYACSMTSSEHGSSGSTLHFHRKSNASQFPLEMCSRDSLFCTLFLLLRFPEKLRKIHTFLRNLTMVSIDGSALRMVVSTNTIPHYEA